MFSVITDGVRNGFTKIQQVREICEKWKKNNKVIKLPNLCSYNEITSNELFNPDSKTRKIYDNFTVT